MKKRISSLLLGIWMLMTLGMPGMAAERAGSVSIRGVQTGEELTVTVSVRELKMNVLELYVAYDARRLTPVEDGGGVLKALQASYDPWTEEGWMQLRGEQDRENGVIRCLVMADPAAADLGMLDSEGYLNAGSTALPLFTIRFRVEAGAQVYGDSVHLGKSTGAPTGIVIADGSVRGITEASVVNVDLGISDTTPGGVAEGYFGGRPAEEPGNSGASGNTGTTGNAGGTVVTGPVTDPGAGTPETPVAVFPDITGHWAKGSIEKLVAAGAVSGYEDGTFRPNAALTRGEFCVVLARYFGLSANTAACAGFTDCESHWAAGYIGAAYAAGLVSGVGNGRFAPDESINREALVTILARAAKVTGGSLTFTDSGEISEWAAGPVAAAVQAGLIAGYPDGSFGPHKEVTRGEMCTVLAQMEE